MRAFTVLDMSFEHIVLSRDGIYTASCVEGLESCTIGIPSKRRHGRTVGLITSKSPSRWLAYHG
jgi:hypothetical protein